MKPRKYLSRRRVLRGALAGGAVALGLPPLEAMFGSDGAYADGTDPEPIFGVFFWANGLPWNDKHGHAGADEWTPAITGPGYGPSPLLLPLAAHQPTVITGLEPHTEVPATPGGQSDGHMRGFMVALTSDRIKPENFDHASHTLTALRPSLDQYVAKHDDFYGAYPPRFRTLWLGVSEARFHEYGHWNAISYNGPGALNQPILDPGALYDWLFAAPDDAAGLGRRAALLDAVMEDAASLRLRLGAADRQRLDDHLDHLSEIQRRLELGTASCSDVPVKPGTSGNLLEKTTLMSQLLAKALSCGLTRVFSFMLTSPATTHIFSNLGVADGMHKACHDGKWNEVRAITEYQMQAFARLLDELAIAQDPTRQSLLQRSLIYGTSEYGEGWQHGVKEMPVVLAGEACGKLVKNVHLREAGGNMSKAHVTLLRALGIDTPSYGFNGGETSEAFDEILG